MSDSLTMAGRSLRLTMRTPDALLTSLLLPVMLMLLFVYLFGGAIQTGTRYVTYVVPGVLLLCAGFGASMTAVSVSHDMTGGIVDRFRSLDVAGAAVLAGHVAASGFTFFMAFLPYPSSAFVPIETMPTWLHGFAENQPITPVIETLRGLLLGTPVGTSPWQALAWCGAILVASVALAGVLFRRRTA